MKKGFILNFIEQTFENMELSNLLSNIMLSEIDFLHNSIRYGYDFIFFMKPYDNEELILTNLRNLLIHFNLNSRVLFTKSLFLALDGFDFLGWHFKVSTNGSFLSTPSFSNYQKFLKRLKRIINNSNFGSVVKANKIFPLVKEWKLYHRFSNLSDSKFSLFQVKKKAFKIFNKESKQDFYSSKNLLSKCFYAINSLESKPKIFYNNRKSPYYGHLIFWLGLNLFEKCNKTKSFYCIHCGVLF